MRFGLIEDDVVVQVAPRPGAGQGEEWVELPPGVTNGARRHQGEWTVPPSGDHVWDSEAEDWDLTPEARARAAREVELKHRRDREADYIDEMADVPENTPLQTLADQVDVIFKQFEMMEAAGLELHPELAAKLAIWRAIKDRHPKPQALAKGQDSR